MRKIILWLIAGVGLMFIWGYISNNVNTVIASIVNGLCVAIGMSIYEEHLKPLKKKLRGKKA
jgi:hypothetical protein